MGKKAIGALCSLLSRLGVTAHFAIVEKRFQACTLVVETFFDPKHHPQSPPEWEAKEWRQNIANFIYDICSDNSLREFLEAVKRDDENALRNWGTTFSSQLKLHPNNQASRADFLMAQGLSDFFRFGKRIEDTPKNAERPSPSVVVLMPALAHINEFLDERNMIADLICDISKDYGPVMDWALKHAKDPSFVSEISSEFGYRQPLDRILRRTEVSVSGDDEGIQCADIVAGLVNYRALEYKTGQNRDPC